MLWKEEIKRFITRWLFAVFIKDFKSAGKADSIVMATIQREIKHIAAMSHRIYKSMQNVPTKCALLCMKQCSNNRLGFRSDISSIASQTFGNNERLDDMRQDTSKQQRQDKYKRDHRRSPQQRLIQCVIVKSESNEDNEVAVVQQIVCQLIRHKKGRVRITCQASKRNMKKKIFLNRFPLSRFLSENLRVNTCLEKVSQNSVVRRRR